MSTDFQKIFNFAIDNGYYFGNACFMCHALTDVSDESDVFTQEQLEAAVEEIETTIRELMGSQFQSLSASLSFFHPELYRYRDNEVYFRNWEAFKRYFVIKKQPNISEEFLAQYRQEHFGEEIQ